MIVDIHNHILSGLDDGACSMEEAILLATNAVENGITHIIATPHHLDGKYMNSSNTVKVAVANLYKELSKRKIPLKIFPGQQVHLSTNFLEEFEKDPLTLANSGKYILIELPNDHIPVHTLDILYKIQLKGLVPIIAHPERSFVLRENKQLLYEFVEKGALIQIKAASLIGMNGRELKRYSKILIQHNLVHFISSDAHHHIKSPFLLKKAYAYIQKKFSTTQATYFQENGKHVIFGTEFQPLLPIGFKKQVVYK